jgi:hypothetical protein
MAKFAELMPIEIRSKFIAELWTSDNLEAHFIIELFVRCFRAVCPSLFFYFFLYLFLLYLSLSFISIFSIFQD